LSGTWGDTVNNFISTYIDSAVAGSVTVTTDTTLTKTTGSSLGATSSQYAIIIASPASANITITAPAASKSYIINNTSGTYTVKIVGAGPTTGVTLAVNEKAIVAWNGSDFVKISSSIVATGTVTAVTGTSPVVSSGGTAPAISLASSYGDTQNPYASKTANNILAAPNGSAGVPTFRALVAADIPTLNQSTTGSAGSVANTLNISSPLSGSSFNGSAATTIALSASYGDTQNPYATKTANYFLAAPNGSSGVPTFRAVVAADIPTLNQNTTGTAAGLSATLVVGSGGTGATTLAGANIPVTNAANTFSATQTFSGSLSTFGTSLLDSNETVNVVAAAPSATTNFYIQSGSVQYYTSNAANNWTLNIAFSSGTSLNSALAVGQSVTFSLITTQSTTAYYNSAVTIDNTSVTPKWIGGAPTAGNASGLDVYRFAVIKTASATYTVLASLTQYK
jgi:hypothetical protein